MHVIWERQHPNPRRVPERRRVILLLPLILLLHDQQPQLSLLHDCKESDDDREEGSDKDSDETVISGAGKDDDEDDDEDDDDDDEEEETANNDEEDKETGKGGDEVRKSGGESKEKEETRVESIFTMTSSQIVSLGPPTPIMTPSTIATITTSGEAPIPPPTIPSIILENLPTFNSAFRFEERLRLLETCFSEYRQTNQFADAVSAILGIVHQYMDQQMMEAVREAVQIQTDRLQDSLQ
nr:hypothetical protein [Tanacetum cinerariifolium]